MFPWEYPAHREMCCPPPRPRPCSQTTYSVLQAYAVAEELTIATRTMDIDQSVFTLAASSEHYADYKEIRCVQIARGIFEIFGVNGEVEDSEPNAELLAVYYFN